MFTKNRTLKLAAAGAGAVALAALSTSAWASGGPGVIVGTDSSATWHDVSAATATVANTDEVIFNAYDATTSSTVTMGCRTASSTGQVHSGPFAPEIADINTVAFSTCHGPGGTMTVSKVGTAPWTLYATGGYTDANNDTIVTGYVDNVNAHVKTSPLSTVCNFDVTGLALGSFNETTQTLTVDETGFSGDLLLSNVGGSGTGTGSGCLGDLHNGDPADFQATLSVSSADGAINVVQNLP